MPLRLDPGDASAPERSAHMAIVARLKEVLLKEFMFE
jgi:hypothetical protein